MDKAKKDRLLRDHRIILEIIRDLESLLSRDMAGEMEAVVTRMASLFGLVLLHERFEETEIQDKDMRDRFRPQAASLQKEHTDVQNALDKLLTDVCDLRGYSSTEELKKMERRLRECFQRIQEHIRREEETFFSDR